MYQTENELEHFGFKDAVLDAVNLLEDSIELDFSAVRIHPENSCNRDIRVMGTSQLKVRLFHAQIVKIIKEGYQVYDADGNLTQSKEEEEISLNQLQEETGNSYVYSFSKLNQSYIVELDGEELTYRVEIIAKSDQEEWERFMNLDNTY